MTIEEISHSICSPLQQFDAVQVGSFPIGVDVPGSDVDIVCCFADQLAFIEYVNHHFSHFGGYVQKMVTSRGVESVVCRFVAFGANIEIFAQKTPVRLQYAWRHMVVEERLLRLGGVEFRNRVMALRKAGMKTEQAFASALQLQGDSYEAINTLCDATDHHLISLISRAAANTM